MSHSGHPFWEFSLQLYARHGVAEASLALQERFDKHRKIARWMFPLWLYVSVTGVVIYVMLYHLFAA